MTDQGLLKNSAVEVDYSRGKVAGLIVVHAILSFLFGIALRFALLSSSAFAILLAAGSGILFLGLFFLLGLLIKSSYLSAIAVLAQIGAMTAAFYDHISLVIAAVFGVSFFVFLVANHLGRRELAELLTVRFWRIGKVVLPKAVLAISIFIGGLSYDISQQTIGTSQSLPISESAFERFLTPAEAPLQYFFPDFRLDSTVREFLTEMSERQIRDNAQLAGLPSGVKNGLVRQSVKELEEKIAAFGGGVMDPHVPLPKAFYDILKAKMASLGREGQDMVAFLLASFVFLVIIGFAWPLRIVASAVAFIFYELLLSSGFATIVLEGRNREIIVVK
ncbi:hypothetical protein HY504_00825 [Candidatus Wolfebacteria bacterium]|nr:hypothetical protein [Candidatus Wolfebacteria bacterium]